MELTATLKELCLLPGLSGYEQKVADYMARRLSAYTDDVRIDKVGNVISCFPGTVPSAPRLMVFAHMDQLGFVVRKLEPDGYLRVERLGGVPERALPALRVAVQTENGDLVQGVIGMKAHHATPPEEKYTVTPYGKLYLDVGAKSAGELKALGVEVGCPVIYEPSFQELRNGLVSGTTLDNRGGCAALLLLAETLKEKPVAANIYIVATVQEEYNLRGACLAAEQIHPDAAVALDIAIAGDTPDLKDRFDVALGEGPVMSMYTFHGRGTLNGNIPHPGLVELFRTVSKERKIPLQRSAATGILTDASYVQLVDGGIPSIDLGFAARYTHSPVEMISVEDLRQLTELVYGGFSAVKPDTAFHR